MSLQELENKYRKIEREEETLKGQEATTELAGQAIYNEKNKNVEEIKEFQARVKELKYEEDIYRLAKKRLKKKIEEQHIKTIQGKLGGEIAKLKDTDTIFNIITNIKNLIYGSEISREAEHSVSYFLLSFTISILLFTALWFLSIKIKSVRGFFNDFFCKKNIY